MVFVFLHDLSHSQIHFRYDSMPVKVMPIKRANNRFMISSEEKKEILMENKGNKMWDFNLKWINRCNLAAKCFLVN